MVPVITEVDHAKCAGNLATQIYFFSLHLFGQSLASISTPPLACQFHNTRASTPCVPTQSASDHHWCSCAHHLCYAWLLLSLLATSPLSPTAPASRGGSSSTTIFLAPQWGRASAWPWLSPLSLPSTMHNEALPPTSRDPSKRFFSWFARHLSGRPEGKTGLDFFLALSTNTPLAHNL